MELIADTNIFLAVVFNEPKKSWIIERTTGATVVAPDLLPYEIGNALSAMVKRRQVTATQALAAEKRIEKISVRLVGVDLQASLQLALEQNIYAYDAYFLQCAKAYSAPLLSLDRRLNQVADALNIRLVE